MTINFGQIMAEIMSDLTKKVNEGLAEAVRQTAEGIEHSYRKNVEAQAVKTMVNVADYGRIGLWNAYDQTVGLTAPSYPRPGRYSDGVLRRALREQGFIAVHRQGNSVALSFADTRLITSQAKQWRRLNYGAGGKADGGENIALLGPALHIGPAPAFKIPKGWWVDNGQRSSPSTRNNTTGRFYPMKLQRLVPRALPGTHPAPQQPRFTAGIAPRHFIEVGINALYARLEENIPAMRDKWVAEIGQLTVAPSPIGGSTTQVRFSRRDGR